MLKINNPNNEAQPGDILHAKNNRNIPGTRPHFIIYLSSEAHSPEEFLGAMLTSSSNYGNIALEENHFEKYDANGVEWQIYYKSSFISSDLYHKKNDWRPFTKVGQLSKDGLQFILEQIGFKDPTYSPLNEV